MTNTDIPGKTVTRELRKKNQGTTGTKITNINATIEKLTITKKRIDTGKKSLEKNLQKCHIKNNLQRTIYRKKNQSKTMTERHLSRIPVPYHTC